jgi:hypothetical protein
MPSLEAFGGVRDRRGHKLPWGFRKGGPHDRRLAGNDFGSPMMEGER